MRWIIVRDDQFGKIFGRIDDDGLMRVTAVEEHPELQEWLSEGNEPEVIEEP